MSKEELQSKLDKTVGIFNDVNKQIVEYEKAREQLRGRIMTYQEMLDEQAPTPESPAQLELVADEESDPVE